MIIKTESIYKSNYNAKLRGLGLIDIRGSMSASIGNGVEKLA
jgi:hypothetical protein